ncbi:hypothetical protein B5C34_08695 [Pacificimonas flava]|uniref:Response regulatory domain-containing protein n=2 Tax=Pacificimonas TaxID=1960290 RepID=A0A219B6V8_9SPHN|nr:MULTISPECIES: response regulator [Pacificimonas]MBZ6379259.1 response regulator [Pacificimonas aurantium]OWV33529.1 hypothetical protein B5C34_08695 [Pacificimonas flava]
MPEKTHAGLTGRHILVVEDEVLIALDIETALEMQGAKVHGPITRLAEGLSIAENSAEEFDGAILDINLQGEEVFPIAEVLSAKGVPFLFHTGHGDSRTLQQQYAKAPVCNKPCQTETLLSELERLVS